MRPDLTHRQALGAGLGMLAAHNIVQNIALNKRGYVTGNVAVSAVLVYLGRAAGLGREEMALVPADARSVRNTIGWSAAGASLGVGLTLVVPGLRRILHDDRARNQSAGEIAEKTLIRFPLGTALFEEVAFRGVLPALLRPGHGAGRAERLAAVAFGLWHVIPTIRALGGNPVGDEVSGPARIATVVGGCSSASLAGIILSSMRNRAGSLLIPWAVHAMANGSMYLAGVIAQRIENEA